MANVTLIGAGSSAFSMSLLRDICLKPSLADSTLTLVDIDERRLNTAAALTERYSREVKSSLRSRAFTDRRKALEDADFVICAVKVGGYGPLECERELAGQHGYYRGIGDRVSCYYGGVGAYHQLAFFERLAKDMEELCPEAWLIQTANPVFEGTNYITRHTKVKAVGVCHGHLAYRRIAERLKLDLGRVSVQMAGFNHCIWLKDFRYEGHDAYPLLDDWIRDESKAYWESDRYEARVNEILAFSDDQMSPGAIDAYRLNGLMPIGDTVRSASPWWHHTDLQAKEKWYGPGGGFDSEIGWSSYLREKDAIQAKSLALSTSIGSLLPEYPPVPSGEQHIEIVDAIANDKEACLQLNIPNRDAVEGLPDDVLVEVPVLAGARGLQAIHVGSLPANLMNNVMIPRMLNMERILDAYVSGSREGLVLWLMNDPRTRSYEQAKGLIDSLLALPWNAKAGEHYR